MGALDALLKALLPVTRVIDAITTWLGKRLAWLILAAVIVSAVNATVRKVFDTSSNSWLELQWVLFSIVFLLCSPWTLLANEHIRIDIVNNLLPKRLRDTHRRGRSRVLPAAADHHHGHHRHSLLPAIVRDQRAVGKCRRLAAMAVQGADHDRICDAASFKGLSELVKRIAVMRDLIPDPHAGQKSSLETEAEEIIGAIEKH